VVGWGSSLAGLRRGGDVATAEELVRVGEHRLGRWRCGVKFVLHHDLIADAFPGDVSLVQDVVHGEGELRVHPHHHLVALLELLAPFARLVDVDDCRHARHVHHGHQAFRALDGAGLELDEAPARVFHATAEGHVPAHLVDVRRPLHEVVLERQHLEFRREPVGLSTQHGPAQGAGYGERVVPGPEVPSEAFLLASVAVGQTLESLDDQGDRPPGGHEAEREPHLKALGQVETTENFDRLRVDDALQPIHRPDGDRPGIVVAQRGADVLIDDEHLLGLYRGDLEEHVHQVGKTEFGPGQRVFQEGALELAAAGLVAETRPSDRFVVRTRFDQPAEDLVDVHPFFGLELGPHLAQELGLDGHVGLLSATKGFCSQGCKAKIEQSDTLVPTAGSLTKRYFRK